MNPVPMSNHRAPCCASLIALAAGGALALSCGDALAARPGVALPGGTLPQGGVVRSGDASVNAPTALPGGRRLQIDQRSQRAIIDWSSFDIAGGSQVHFNQGGPTFEALNRIFDQSPSVIQGRLSATGRVYLYNQNGILFDRGSQVDVRGLIASSLEIPESVFLSGLGSTANETQPALLGTVRPVLLDANGVAVTDLEGRPWRNPVQNYGTLRSVEVDAAGNPTGNAPGGLIALFAPQVENRGVTVADNGQVILAAGTTVFLQQYRGVPNSPDEFAMRGLVVRVQAGAEPLDLSGLVSNFGSARADRGNVSMVGLAVNQSGRASAGTAVNQNGSVWLLANDRLTLAAGSVTETPLADDGQTQVEEQAYEPNRGRIKLGGTIVDHKGAISAPGGVVQIGGASSGGESVIRPRRVFLDAGSTLSVAGNIADLPAEKNAVTVRIGTNDLRDTPEQKGGFLFGKNVTFDLTRGNPKMFDISEIAASVPRTVGEKAAAGGSVSVSADEFVAQSGSAIDFSGGAWRFSAGNAVSSKVFAGGSVFDIHDAPPNLRYDALVEVVPTVTEGDRQRWNAEGIRRLVAVADRGYQVFEVIPNPKWLSAAALVPSAARRLFPQRQGYVEGRPGGSLEILAPQIVLNGAVHGGVSIGRYQRPAPPRGGIVTLGDPAVFGDLSSSPSFQLTNVNFVGSVSPLSEGFGADTPLPVARLGTVEISASSFGIGQDQPGIGGFRESRPDTLVVNAGRAISVAPDASVELAAGGRLELHADRFDIAGTLDVPAGTVSMTRGGADRFQSSSLTLAPGARIATTGLWFNDFLDGPGAVQGPLLTAGGNVDLRAASLDLQAGSLIDVSGGGSFSAARRIAAGAGGNVTLLGNAVPGVGDADRNGLALAGKVLGFSAADGGTLRLRTNRVTLAPELAGGARSASEAKGLALAPAFFSSMGFDAYDIEADFSLDVAGGTQLRPQASSLLLAPQDVADMPTGSRMAELTVAAVEAGSAHSVIAPLPPHQRRGVSLDLESRASQGDDSTGLRMTQGSSIETDAGGRIELKSGTLMDVAGVLRAPAGEIRVELSTAGRDVFGGRTLNVASTARLEAPGAFIAQPTLDGSRRGEVKRGGNVTLTASRNDLAVQPGAVVDVSATAADLDLPTGDRKPLERRRVEGEAGVVRVTATEDAWLGGTFLGRSALGAGAGALGLDFRFHDAERQESNDPRLFDVEHRVVVTQGRPQRPDFETGVRRAAIGADMLMEGGFGSIRLASQDAVEFPASVSLQATRRITLDAPEIRAADGATVQLGAPGLEFRNTPGRLRPSTFGIDRIPVAATAGTATLAASGGFVEFSGHLAFSGFGELAFASSGTMRAGTFPMEASRLSQVVSERERTSREALSGSLSTLADIMLQAREVVASTGVDFSVSISPTPDAPSARPGSVLRIEGNGAAAPALAADGRLRFHADSIEQGGTVLAPLGQIEFAADSSVTLKEGSLTSVAADRTIPFGGTVNGLSLFYGLLDRTATPPDKSVVLSATDVTVASGARVDISGGGELQAVEFVPGAGGSRDVLLDGGTFAILPGMTLDRAPADSHIARLYAQSGQVLDFGADRNLYDSVEVGAGVPGLPAGTYALLPGYYALLPGAYTVRRESGSTDFLPGTATARSDGATLVAGRLAAAGTPVRESRWSALGVAPGEMARRASEYRIANSDFLVGRAAIEERATPQVAADAGRLEVAPRRRLVFGGSLAAAPGGGGNLGQVDLTAQRLAVVARAGAGEAPADYFEIESGLISSFNASVSLGGRRSRGSGGTLLDVVTDRIFIGGDAQNPISVPELVVTAREQVSVGSTAVVQASGAAPGSDQPVEIVPGPGGLDGSALLRVSSGGDATVIRRGIADTSLGNIDVATGSLLQGRAIALDATGASKFEGRLDVVTGGALALGASRISLGNAPLGTEGLVLSATQLTALQGTADLTLRSSSSIDLYGSTHVASGGRLTLDAAGIAGRTSGATDIVTAVDLSFRNTSGRSFVEDPSGTGTLSIAAERIELGAGDKTIAGFNQVTLVARGELLSTGRRSAGAASDPTFTVAGDLTLNAARIGAAAGSAQRIEARDTRDAAAPWRSVQIGLPANPAEIATTATAGGKLGVFGSAITHRGRIELPAGIVELGARGGVAGDGSGQVLPDGTLPDVGSGILVADGSLIATRGFARTFAGDTVAAPAGRVSLMADRGDIAMLPGSALDVSSTGSGDAGVADIRAAQGTVGLAGSIVGSASDRAEGGRLSVDARRVADLEGLIRSVGADVFTGAVDIRQRVGDVSADALEITTREFTLAADEGNLSFGGTVNAGGSSGGRIGLFAGGNLMLTATARLNAAGTASDTKFEAPFGHGGEVTVASRGGRVTMDPGAQINVSAAPEGKSDGGRVVFSAPRIGRPDGSVGVAMELAGDVALSGGIAGVDRNGDALGRSGEVIVEGLSRYNPGADAGAGVLADAGSNPAYGDYVAFSNSAALIRSGVNLTGLTAEQIRVRAGIELDHAGDMTLAVPWDLSAAAWRLNDVSGRLALRAGGNLALSSGLGFAADVELPGQNTVTAANRVRVDVLPAGRTWDIDLVGGADLASADLLRTQAGAAAGDVILASAEARVRSGSGAIRVSAGRDFVIADAGAAIYTAGEAAVVDGQLNRFTHRGGNLQIKAEGSVKGPATLPFVTDWLRRTTENTITFRDIPAGWWAHRAAFKGGVGSFGGGDIRVSARGSISNLLAVAPTSGQAFATAGVERLAVRAGGKVRIEAGEDIEGGEVLVGRGSARMLTGGSLGSVSRPDLFVLGESGTPAGYDVEIEAIARGDLAIGSASNPTILLLSGPTLGSAAQRRPDGFGRSRAAFFSYSPQAAAILTSVTGDVRFGNRADNRGSVSDRVEWSQYYPPNFDALAFSGSVIGPGFDVVQGMRLFPSRDQSMRLYAKDSVRAVPLLAGDGLPERAPNWQAPVVVFGEGGQAPTTLSNRVNEAIAGDAPAKPRMVQASSADEFRYRIVAGDGNVEESTFNFFDSALVESGRDLFNLRLNLQNLSVGSATVLRAGRDLKYGVNLADGNAVQAESAFIRIGGPGRLRVQAGRDIDFGQAAGIVAGGNAFNTSLASGQSAAVTVLAGVRGDLSQAVIDNLGDGLRALNTMRVGSQVEIEATATVLGFIAPALGLAGTVDFLLDALATSPAARINLPGGIVEASFVESPTSTESAVTGRTIRVTLPVELVEAAVAGAPPLAPAFGVPEGIARALSNVKAPPGSDFEALTRAALRGEGIAAEPGSETDRLAVAVLKAYSLEGESRLKQRASNMIIEAALAPVQLGEGDIRMVFSQVRTQGGSPIDVLTPRGGMEVGLPVVVLDSQGNPAEDLGIVTGLGGNVRAFLRGDMNINLSKVIGALGGDIQIYAGLGSIDAGRGPRDSRSTQPPRFEINPESGERIFRPPTDVGGSGIRTITFDPDGAGPLAQPRTGSIFLFAPTGTVDAGEAGISSAGGIFIEALSVLNASNISSSGPASGVPTVQTGAIAGVAAGASSATAGTTPDAQDATRSASDASTNAARDAFRPPFLTVEVLGYGDGNDDQDRKRGPSVSPQ